MSEAAAQDVGQRRGDRTRSRIQQVALELFAEQGYQRTSLREIAERLDITKAALYYHFKSKEDIVGSLTEDFLADFDELLNWARQEPPGPERRTAIVDRYLDVFLRGMEVFRFLERNQAALRGMEDGKRRFEQFRPRLIELAGLLAEPDASLRGRIRATVALISAHFSWFLFTGEDQPAQPDPAELRAIITELAADLVADL
jgi:AcrR family transcriptional regulator